MNPLLLLALAAGPLSPREEQATFRLAPGFTITLAAAEPDVVDPVAACFDAAGRLYVCEMRGYPNGGVGTGNETRGRIRRLEDRDGDGVFETAVTFADGLRFPMGIAPWRNGIVVAVAPDLIYLEDTDGDGKADVKRVLYTGFTTANIQQMVSSLTWGLDNRLHGVAGNDGGTIRSAEKPDAPAVTLRSRGFRLDPGTPGSLEPESGGGQYGLAFDPFGRTFTATNSQHLRQILIPDHAVRRNPNVPVAAVTADIPDHGPACRVYRISPFEGWRVERTARRAGGTDARRFPTTELSPGGYITSACSPLVWGNESFVCDPANNLVHRDRLDFTTGAAAVARRVDDGCEVLASTDNWFRPVSLLHAPDGSVLLLDFYREVIETPLSLPDDIKVKLNLESRERGRIWRLERTNTRTARALNLAKCTDAELAAKLTDPAVWVRETARRLLVDRRAAVDLSPLAHDARGTERLPNVLATLHGLGTLTDDQLAAALADPRPDNRGYALRLAEPRLAASAALRAEMTTLAADRSAEVRFQTALAAGAMTVTDAAQILAEIAARDAADPWTQSALLLSAREGAADLVTKLLADNPAAARPLLPRAAAAVAGDTAAVNRLVSAALTHEAELPAVLDALPRKPPLAERFPQLAEPFARAAAVCRSGSPTVAAARLLAHAPSAVGREPLVGLLKPTVPEDVQLAAIASLSAGAGSVEPLLSAWPTLGPAGRRAVQEAVAARPERVSLLLAAVEAGRIPAKELDPARVTQLRAHANPAIKARAVKLFPDPAGSDRAAVVAKYAAASGGGDAARGKVVFAANCAGCHRLENAGHAVGPDLLATVPGKSDADLSTAVFDPNREIDPRFVSYVAELSDGHQATGLLVADGPGHITLRRADGAEDVIRRADLDHLRSSGKSLMPDGLEATVSVASFADLLAYLRAATRPGTIDRPPLRP